MNLQFIVNDLYELIFRRGGDYVMQDITRIEDHQYQTITSDDKIKQSDQKASENIKHTKSKTAHDIVLRKKGRWSISKSSLMAVYQLC